MARSGLRMMPTFPPSPLSFRTASFPQYGWKVGLSGSAFPCAAPVKPAPGIPRAPLRFASALRASCGATLRPALCQDSGLSDALPCEESSPLPQRPSLRSGFYCPSPSSLNRPHAPHSPAHPDFAAWRFIPDALAVLVRLGDEWFRAFATRSFSACRPLGPRGVRRLHLLSSSPTILPSPNDQRLGTPDYPSSASDGGGISRLPWFTFATACRVARPSGGSDRVSTQPTGTFTSELSIGSVTLPVVGYNYGGH